MCFWRDKTFFRRAITYFWWAMTCFWGAIPCFGGHNMFSVSRMLGQIADILYLSLRVGANSNFETNTNTNSIHFLKMK